MSRNKGIGHAYFEKYKDEIYRDDYIIINNKKMKPPSYYDNLMKKVSENVLQDVKAERYRIAKDQADFEDIERMYAKELCRELELKQWNRSL